MGLKRRRPRSLNSRLTAVPDSANKPDNQQHTHIGKADPPKESIYRAHAEKEDTNLTKGIFLPRVIPDYSPVDRIPEGVVHVDGQGVGNPHEQVHEESVVHVLGHLHPRTEYKKKKTRTRLVGGVAPSRSKVKGIRSQGGRDYCVAFSPADQVTNGL